MTSKIATALNEVMKATGMVKKTGHNDYQNYDYATEADLLEVIRPAMIENGLLLIPSIENVSEIDQYGNTTVRVEYTLVHTSGEVWPKTVVGYGCGNDRARNGNVGDKGLYKAITGANKYVLFKLFQIATGDDPEVPNQIEQPSKAAKTTTLDDLVDEPVNIRPQTITEEAVEAVDEAPKKELLRPTSKQAMPTNEQEWKDFTTICNVWFRTQAYRDIATFWRTNKEIFDELKKNDEETYTTLYREMMKRKAK